MEQILSQWYASQNAATQAILKKVVAKKIFTLIVPNASVKAFPFVEISI